MKISRLVVRHLQRDMGDRVWNAQTRWNVKNVLIVFAETDSEHIGLGECWVTGSSVDALVKTIEEDIAPHVVGKNPFAVNAIWQDVFQSTAVSGRRGITSAALSGVDTALWDLMGKATNTPLYQLLGAGNETVRCYASAGLYGKDKGLPELAAEMTGYQQQNFADVKMKVGGVGLAEDVERVRTVRKAIGADARLMVDANYNLDVPRALQMANAFAPFDITWFEAPVHPDDVTGLTTINKKSPIPVCGNETEWGVPAFRRLIDARAVEYVQPDIAICGGISEARRIADYATAHHMPVTLHASSTVILLAASLHLGAGLRQIDSLEYHMLHHWLADRFPETNFKAQPGGWVKPPNGAGIGLKLSPEEIGHAL